METIVQREKIDSILEYCDDKMSLLEFKTLMDKALDNTPIENWHQLSVQSSYEEGYEGEIDTSINIVYTRDETDLEYQARINDIKNYELRELRRLQAKYKEELNGI